MVVRKYINTNKVTIPVRKVAIEVECKLKVIQNKKINGNK